ncbi:MAG: hypothetical protein GY771_15010, partial [bacterium]|nr:hypothetical protein [bacterium]
MALKTDNSKKYPIPDEIYRPYQLAITLLRKGETERARTALFGLLEVYPDTTGLLNSIGNTFFEEDNLDKA